MDSLFKGTFAILRFFTAGEEISSSLSLPRSGRVPLVDLGFEKLAIEVISLSCSTSVGSSVYNFLTACLTGDDDDN